ncbi:MAG: alanine racemase [Luteibaculaceae bacterium]
MARIYLNRQKLKNNYDKLSSIVNEADIKWGVVSKLLCGTEKFIQEIINLGITEFHDSRLNNLKKVKKLLPASKTVYIKPPAKKSLKGIISYADVSFNTQLSTILLLNEEAKKQNKTHQIIIMIEMGDLREGVLGEKLIDFYGKVFELSNIEVIGIGTNFNCLYGVMPSHDKLIQLALYKQLIELKFQVDLPIISGGSSVLIPLILQKQVPKSINHLRIGEVLFFGKNLYTGTTINGFCDDVFTLEVELIEVLEKPKVPVGEFAPNPSGEMYSVNPKDIGKKSYRAIADIGLLDINPDYLIPENNEIECIGASSDMLVFDLKNNPNNLNAGDTISFKLNYMGALSILNSYYIEKLVV